MSSQEKRKCPSKRNNEPPHGWVVGYSSTRKKNYYFNTITGVSTWNKPEESSFRERNSSIKPKVTVPKRDILKAHRTLESRVIKKPQELLQSPSFLPARSPQVNAQKNNLVCANHLSLASNVGTKVKFKLKQQTSLKKPAEVFKVNLNHCKSEIDGSGNSRFHEVIFGKVTKNKNPKRKTKSLEVNLSSSTEKKGENNNKSSFSINVSNHAERQNTSLDAANNPRGFNILQKKGKNSIISKGTTDRDTRLECERSSTSKLTPKKDLPSHFDKSSSLSYPEITKNSRKLTQDELVRRYNKSHPNKKYKEKEDACHPTASSKIHNSCKVTDIPFEEKKSIARIPTSRCRNVSTIKSVRVVSQSTLNKSVRSSSAVDVNSCKHTSVANEKEEVDMDWEAIEDEKVLINIQEHRQQFRGMRNSNFDSPPEDMEVNYFDFSSSGNKSCVIVLDTNILISHRIFVEELSEKEHKGLRSPILIIPWMVLKELDSLKGNRGSSKNPKLQSSARSAIQFINRCFNARHPRVKGQSAMDDKEECFKIEVPDDNILNCCLQLLKKGKRTILLSNDINLRNKALTNGVQSYGKEQLTNSIKSGALEQLFLPPSNAVNEIIYQQFDSAIETTLPKVPEKQYDKPTSQILYSKFEKLLHQFLSKILEAEMKNAFEEMWIKVVYLKPPWSLLDTLRCLLKHWCAVFSFIMDFTAKNTIEKLISFFKRPLLGPCLKEIESAVESGVDLCGSITSKDFKDLASEYKHYFKALLRSGQDNLQNINPAVLNDSCSVATSTNPADEAEKNSVFEAFQMALSLVNNYCGILCDSLGINHGIVYQKPEVFPSLEEMKERLPNVCKYVGNLTNSMSSLLEIQVSSLSTQHPALLSLHASLQAVIPSDCHLFHGLSCERLHSFAVEGNTRLMLFNGVNQFTEFQMLLTKVISCIVER